MRLKAVVVEILVRLNYVIKCMVRQFIHYHSFTIILRRSRFYDWFRKFSYIRPTKLFLNYILLKSSASFCHLRILIFVHFDQISTFKVSCQSIIIPFELISLFFFNFRMKASFPKKNISIKKRSKTPSVRQTLRAGCAIKTWSIFNFMVSLEAYECLLLKFRMTSESSITVSEQFATQWTMSRKTA